MAPGGLGSIAAQAVTVSPGWAVTTPVSTSSTSTWSSAAGSVAAGRGRLGAGLVDVPPVPYRDPIGAIMIAPEVAEHRRFCGSCGKPIGRSVGGRLGRPEGFCGHCGAAYSFTPKLTKGDLVAGQYEVLGCLAHGGLGWVYLARDRNVSDRWVVLKGLLDTSDSDALAAAGSERRFLARVEHPLIVKIHNFVEHPNPKTGELAGYIVMEYIGGVSLNSLRAEPDVDGKPTPMTVARALAYILEILPALGYLHGIGLLYCDFKPDNVFQIEEHLKLIDLGAVRRADDPDSASYKTDGFCAPELETEGPTVASDIYTVGRALAVLTFNFDYTSAYRYRLPDAVDVPVLERYESFHRLLLRATAEDPAERFTSATEMAEQITGVLREVLAADDNRPRPAQSTVFSAEREEFGCEIRAWPVPLEPALVATALPVPVVDPTDAAASFLATNTITDPRRLDGLLRNIGLSTVETAFALVRAKIEVRNVPNALRDLFELGKSSPGDWRITWYRGLAELTGRDLTKARTFLDETYRRFPGEAAPKLALAAVEECLGRYAAAERYYELVWRADHAYVSAAFGLARTRLARGDRAGAVAAVESVPPSASHHTAALLAAVRARAWLGNGAPPTEEDLVAAGAALVAIGLDAEWQAHVGIEVLTAAVAWARQNYAPTTGKVLGHRLREGDLRRGLERQFRTLARLARTKEERVQFVERANEVRPVTWM
jgi:serine/threonine-protein kinase PknG